MLLRSLWTHRQGRSGSASNPGSSEGFLGPLVLLHDLCLFLWGEIVLNVKEFANLGNGAVLDQTGDLGAGKLEQGLDIEVVGSQDQLEEDLLVKVHKLGVPGGGDITQVVRSQRLLNLGGGIISTTGKQRLDIRNDWAGFKLLT